MHVILFSTLHSKYVLEEIVDTEMNIELILNFTLQNNYFAKDPFYLLFKRQFAFLSDFIPPSVLTPTHAYLLR